MIQALLFAGYRLAAGAVCEALVVGAHSGEKGGCMLTSILMGLGLLLLFEGLGPLLMPRAWQQMLRLLSDQPAEQLRRIGGCLVVAGAVILWALAR